MRSNRAVVATVVSALAAMLSCMFVWGFADAAAASGHSWTGKGDGTSWSDAKNWDGGVPQDGDSASIGPLPGNPSPSVKGMPGGTSLADLTLDGANLSGGSVTVNGSFSWSDGSGFNSTLDAPLEVDGTASISGVRQKTVAQGDPMTLVGTTTLSGSGKLVLLTSGKAIDNQGTFNLGPGATIQASACCATPDQFVNTGTVTVPSGGTATLAWLDFQDQGGVSVASGSTLSLTVGPAELSDAASFQGGGTVEFGQGAHVTLGNNMSLASGTTFMLGNVTSGQALPTLSGTGSLAGSGKFLWTGGTLSGTLSIADTITSTISGSDAKSMLAPGGHAVLNLHGPTTLSAKLSTGGAQINNSGTFTMQPGALIQAGACCLSPDQFVNTGSVAVPAAGTATLAWLDFQDHGSVSATAGSTLLVTVGPAELSDGVAFKGGGTVQFAQGAHVTLGKAVSVAADTTFKLGNLLGGQALATLSGTGGLVGAGKFLWAAGTLSGTLTVASTVTTTISGSDPKSMSGVSGQRAVLNLQGPTTLSAKLTTGGAQINNSGAFTMQPGAIVQAGSCCASPDQFVNTGSVTVPSAGTATLALLDFRDQGSVSATAAATLLVTVGPSELASGVGFKGGGTVQFGQGARVTLASNLSVASDTTLMLGNPVSGQGGATLAGTGSLTGGGKFLWTGGTLSGTLTIASTITTTISGSDGKSMIGPSGQRAVLNLQGPTTLSAKLTTGGAQINNSGNLTMEAGAAVAAGACCVSPDQFVNTGHLTVAAGTGTATTTALSFTTSGSVTVTSGTFSVDNLPYQQTGGSTSLAGGTLSSAQPVKVVGGSLGGHGTVHASVVNGGTLHPSATGGVLSVTGTYQQTSSGTLQTDITGATAGNGFGQLVVQGAATLDGKIAANTSGGFKPSPGQTFSVLTYPSHTGQFSTRVGNDLGYAVIYGSAATTLLYGIPVITSVSPNAGPVAGQNTVTINGVNFTPSTKVHFGTSAPASTTFVSASQLRVTAPANASGVVHVTATNSVGTSAPGNSDLYGYGPPSVSSFTPASGITGSTVTITGTNFVPGTKVKFGALASQAVTFVSPTQVKATVPSGAVTAKLSVSTAAGSTISASSYAVTLSITAFSPASGPVGTVVTITGIGFNNASTVKFGATAAEIVTFVSPSQLKAMVPNGATSGPITVTNTTAPTGTVRSATNYALGTQPPPGLAPAPHRSSAASGVTSPLEMHVNRATSTDVRDGRPNGKPTHGFGGHVGDRRAARLGCEHKPATARRLRRAARACSARRAIDGSVHRARMVG